MSTNNENFENNERFHAVSSIHVGGRQYTNTSLTLAIYNIQQM